MGFLRKLFGKKEKQGIVMEKQAENIVPIVLPAQSDEMFIEKDEPSLEVETVEEVQVEEISVEETLAEEIPTKEIPTVQEPVKMEETSVVTNEENIIEEKEEYLFQFAMTDENIRNKVIEFIKPITNEWDIINLQLAYGVLETKTNIFIVRTKCTQTWGERRVISNTTYFAALIEDSIIPISYTVAGSRDEGEATYEVPEEYADVLSQALEYWRNWSEHKKYESEYNKSHEKSILNLINRYRKPLYKLIPEEVKESYEINSLEDAKRLFFLCDKDTYSKMAKKYDDATIKTFNQYADYKQQTKWVVEECEEILNKIIEGDFDGLSDKLNQVSRNCRHGIDTIDDLAEIYYKVCCVIYSKVEEVPLECISNYLSHYERRFNPLHAIPIIDLTEQYIKEKYTEEYFDNDSENEMLEIKNMCTRIRRKAADKSPIDNIYKFKFTYVTEEILDSVVRWYYNKYNDMEAVKEILAEFNCVYGVQNEEIFLTAMTDAAESPGTPDFYRREYLVINLKSGTIVDFECKQKKEDGSYYLERYSSENHIELTMNALAFFRNELEREAFFEEYANNHDGEKLYYTKDKARKKWFSTLGKTFTKLLKRIGENPLSETLKAFVDFCETIAPEYGYQNVVVNRAATENAIEKWQQKNGICLPENYRHFLRFANGCVLGSDTTRIAGLDEIVLVNEYIKPEYMIIGSIIGDGTTLCMEKSTGEAYIEDHGEYQRVGDFKELLEYVMDLF